MFGLSKNKVYMISMPGAPRNSLRKVEDFLREHNISAMAFDRNIDVREL